MRLVAMACRNVRKFLDPLGLNTDDFAKSFERWMYDNYFDALKENVPNEQPMYLSAGELEHQLYLFLVSEKRTDILMRERLGAQVQWEAANIKPIVRENVMLKEQVQLLLLAAGLDWELELQEEQDGD